MRFIFAPFIFLLHLVTFGAFRTPKLDFLEMIRKGHRVSFSAITGTSEKEMKRTLRMICGKNMEYVLTDLDGMLRIGSIRGAKTSDDLFTVINDNSRFGIDMYIVGKGAKFLDKILKGETYVVYNGYNIIDNHNAMQHLEDQFVELVTDSVVDYKTKSKKKVVGFPDKCPSCKTIFGIPEQGEFCEDCEDFHYETFGIRYDGTCEKCGAVARKPKPKDVINAYIDIRKFEGETGVKILPKVV